MRHRAFPGPRNETAEKYERAYRWLQATIFESPGAREWCKTHGVPVRRAAAEGVDSLGGFLVPQPLANAILDLRDLYGAFRRRARILPMPSDSTPVPAHVGTNTTATFAAENAAASTASASVDSRSLTAKKLTALIQISSEVEEDAYDGVVDFVANEIAFAFAQKEDDCGFNGDGTSTYAGMRGVATTALDGNHNQSKITAASGHNTFAGLDTTDLGNLISGVMASAIPNAAWFCSQTCFAVTFCRLAGSAGGAYLETGMVNGIRTPFYLGFPVSLTQKLPLIPTTLSGSVMLCFGDLEMGALLGERRGITLARSWHRYFDSDQLGILGTERFDALVTQMGDNTNRGAIAALVGN